MSACRARPAFLVDPLVAAGAALGVILSAVYALTLYRKVVFGDMVNPALAAITDIDAREWAIFIPLIAATLAIGVYPSLVTDVTGPAVNALVAHVAQAIAN